MSLEFPTSKIALPIQTIHLLLRKIVLDKGGTLKNDGDSISIEKEYLLTLSHKETEEKLNRIASRRLRSREYLFFFFGLFFLAIFTELFILKLFFGDESKKTIPYFQTNNPEGRTTKLVLIKNSSTTPTVTRGLQPWVAVLLVMATSGSFSAFYQSRRGRERKIENLKEKITQEMKQKNLDIKIEKRSESFHLDLVDYGQSTEIIFLTEEGSPLISHFIATMIATGQKYGTKNSHSPLITGNQALQQLLQKFKNHSISDWEFDHQALTQSGFPNTIEENTDY